MGGFYRRYSDDILIICHIEQQEAIKEFIKSEIAKSKVDISDEKTETYLFKKEQTPGKKEFKIASYQVLKNGNTISKPLTYLGFEFYGNKSLIKSANLAKFYRRMIYSVKRKAILAVKIAEITGSNPIIYRGRLKRLYTKLKLNSTRQYSKHKKLVLRSDGFYEYRFKNPSKKHTSNYFSYVKRASKLMGDMSIEKQLRKHKAIFNNAVSKHLAKAQRRH